MNSVVATKVLAHACMLAYPPDTKIENEKLLLDFCFLRKEKVLTGQIYKVNLPQTIQWCRRMQSIR